MVLLRSLFMRSVECSGSVTHHASRITLLLLAALAAGFALLARLAAHFLAVIADTLALIRLRLADAANLCRGQADQLFVDALDDHERRTRSGVHAGLELDAGPRRNLDSMREPNRKRQVLAGNGGPIADAMHVELSRIAVGHALDHVRDDRARKAVKRPVILAVGRPVDRQSAVLDLEDHVWMHRLRQGPFWSFDDNLPIPELYVHALRKRYR